MDKSLLGTETHCIATDSRYLTMCPFNIDIISADKETLWIPETGLSEFSLSELVNGTYLNQMKGYFVNG